MLLLRSTLFSFGMIFITVTHASLSLLLGWFMPFTTRYYFITFWSRFIVWWLKITCNIDYQVHGLEHIPKDQAMIVLSKHQSTWETLAFQVIFPPQTWVLKRELLRVPFFGWALALLEPIAINREARKSAMTQLITQGREKLKQKRWVIVFPEGTRCKIGEEKPFAKGGATLAAETGYPVLPVTHNAGRFWPRRSFIKHPGTIQVIIGPVIESKGLTAQMINERAKAWIDDASKTL